MLFQFAVIRFDVTERFFTRIGTYQVVQDAVDKALVAQFARSRQGFAVERIAALEVVERAVDVAHHVADLRIKVVETVVFAHFQAVEIVLHGFGIGAAGIAEVADVAQGLGTGVLVGRILALGCAAGQHVEGREGQFLVAILQRTLAPGQQGGVVQAGQPGILRLDLLRKHVGGCAVFGA